MRTRLYVDDSEMSTSHRRLVVVRVQYGDKTARIELSRSESPTEMEPGAESFGHALHDLMQALSAWEQSGGVIEWPSQSRTVSRRKPAG